MNQRQSLNSAKKQQKHTQRGRRAEGTGGGSGTAAETRKMGRKRRIKKRGDSKKQRGGEAEDAFWRSMSPTSADLGRIRIREVSRKTGR